MHQLATRLLAMSSLLLGSRLSGQSPLIHFEVREGFLMQDGGVPGCGGEVVRTRLKGSFDVEILLQETHAVHCRIRSLELTSLDGSQEVVVGAGTYVHYAHPPQLIDDPPPGCAFMELVVQVDELLDLRLYADECLLRDHRFPTIILSGFQQGHPLRSCISLVVIARPALEDAPRFFVRGDWDGDGQRSIGDVVSFLNDLFLGSRGNSCEDAADADDSGTMDIADAVLVLDHLFRGSGHLPIPSVLCGIDPSDDALTCEGQAACMPG